VEGERAYDLAREGVELDLAPRPVTIHRIEVADQPDADHIELQLDCGKGAYVRAVVRDLAEALGACGHVAALRRTRVGPLTEDRAITLEMLEDLCHRGARPEVLLPVETALDDIPALALTTEDAFRLTQGRSIVLLPRQAEALKASLTEGSRTVAAFEGGRVVALCEMRAGRLNPTRVFHL
jgi:tRNA pseudouridine55 synthase